MSGDDDLGELRKCFLVGKLANDLIHEIERGDRGIRRRHAAGSPILAALWPEQLIRRRCVRLGDEARSDNDRIGKGTGKKAGGSSGLEVVIRIAAGTVNHYEGARYVRIAFVERKSRVHH